METACPVCGSARRRIVQRALIGRKTVSTHLCMQCGLRYLEPGSFATELYDKERYTLPPEVGSEARDFLTYLRPLASKQGARLLDIGCNDGALLKAARNMGFEAVGNELYESRAVRELRKQGFRVECGDIAKIRFAERFDAITMSHVIEHLTHPDMLLSAVHRLLKEDGRLAVATPNYGGLFYCVMYLHPYFMKRLYAGPYRGVRFADGIPEIYPKKLDSASLNWYRMLELEHTLQFNKRSLIWLMRKNGFALERHLSGNTIPSPPEKLSLKYALKRIVWSRAANRLLKAFNLQTELFMIFRKARASRTA